MERDIKHARISVIIHTAAAIVVANISILLANNLFAGVVGIATLVAIGYLLEKFLGKRGFKWWFANGMFIYIFVWLVGWIYFFNLGLYL